MLFKSAPNLEKNPKELAKHTSAEESLREAFVEHLEPKEEKH
jgi:hypothetical protein